MDFAEKDEQSSALVPIGAIVAVLSLLTAIEIKMLGGKTWAYRIQKRNHEHARADVRRLSQPSASSTVRARNHPARALEPIREPSKRRPFSTNHIAITPLPLGCFHPDGGVFAVFVPVFAPIANSWCRFPKFFNRSRLPPWTNTKPIIACWGNFFHDRDVCFRR